MLREFHSSPRHEGSFLRELVRQFRAQLEGDAWDGKDDGELLAPLVLGRRRNGAHDDAGEPDPDVFLRIEIFHAAVALEIEHRTGLACTPMMRMHHDGFGRVVILAGRLAVVSRYLRDAQRFGFDSLEKLAEAGEKLVASGVEMIERFPEAARYGA